MGTKEEVFVPSEWTFYDAEAETAKPGRESLDQNGALYVSNAEHPRRGVSLTTIGARRLYHALREIFSPSEERVAETLPRVIEHLEKELAALKDQRRWELYLVFVKMLIDEKPTHDTISGNANFVDKMAKAYVNAIMPAGPEKTDD